MKKILIAGGSGFIGQQLIQHWHDKDISIISRNKNAIAGVKSMFDWNDLKQQGKEICSNQDLIINLTGANIGAKRWTSKRKQEILQSRLFSTEMLKNICVELSEKAPTLFNASAIGVYNLHPSHHQAYTESTNIDFDTYPNFLAEVARKWEKATWSPTDSHCRVINLRFGVVLSQNGGALKQIAMPFYFGLGGPIGSGKQFFSWIHINDLINAIEFLYQHTDINGAVNIVAPGAIPQKEFAKALGQVLKRPSFMPMPSFTLELLFGQMADELLLQGQNVFPEKLTQAGFKFQFPTIKNALQQIFQ